MANCLLRDKNLRTSFQPFATTSPSSRAEFDRDNLLAFMVTDGNVHMALCMSWFNNDSSKQSSGSNKKLHTRRIMSSLVNVDTKWFRRFGQDASIRTTLPSTSTLEGVPISLYT
jgi:hypothetical protein